MSAKISLDLYTTRKDLGMACLKVYKQGRDNTKMETTIQRPIPTSLTALV